MVAKQRNNTQTTRLNVYIQQNGVSAHTAREATKVNRHMFPGRVIARFGKIPLPPDPQIRTITTFSCGDILKSQVYIIQHH